MTDIQTGTAVRLIWAVRALTDALAEAAFAAAGWQASAQVRTADPAIGQAAAKRSFTGSVPGSGPW